MNEQIIKELLETQKEFIENFDKRINLLDKRIDGLYKVHKDLNNIIEGILRLK